MNPLEDRNFIILLVVLFPLMILAGAMYLRSNVCVMISLLTWVGLALLVLYIPTAGNGDL